MLTMLDVIVLDVLPALILGLVIALLLLVFQASRPRVSMLERGVRRPQPPPRDRARARRADVRPDAPLFYANVEMVRDAIEHAVISSAEPARAVVLVLDGNDHQRRGSASWPAA